MNGAAQALTAGGADGTGGAGAQPGGSDAAEDNAGADKDTFFLPPDFLGGKKYKKGDTISLTVMGEDEDGDTEVCLAGEDGGDDWKSDLKKTMEAAGSSSSGQ